MENPLEDVIQWLEAGDAADYRAGLALLEHHSRNRALLDTLRRKESANNKAKLTYELAKLVAGGRLEDLGEVMSHFAQAVQQAVAPAVAPLVEQPAPDAVPEAVRADVDELTLRMAHIHNRRCQLSNSLHGIDAATDGPRVVGEILSLQNQYNELAEKRRRLASGQPVAPEAPASAEITGGGVAPVVDRAELIQKRGNLRSSLSKAKASAAKKPDDQLKAEKVARLVVELDVLEMQIKQLPA